MKTVVDKAYELDQQIMHAWSVIDEIRTLIERFVDKEEFDVDNFCNHAQAIEVLYDLKFHKLYDTYCEMLAEFNSIRKELKKDDKS